MTYSVLITHNPLAPVYCRSTTIEGEELGTYTRVYVEGELCPHYPVPATIGFIDFNEQGEHTWLEYQGLLALWEYGWTDLEREQVCQYQDMECVQEHGDDASLINALSSMLED